MVNIQQMILLWFVPVLLGLIYALPTDPSPCWSSASQPLGGSPLFTPFKAGSSPLSHPTQVSWSLVCFPWCFQHTLCLPLLFSKLESSRDWLESTQVDVTQVVVQNQPWLFNQGWNRLETIRNNIGLWDLTWMKTRHENVVILFYFFKII